MGPVSSSKLLFNELISLREFSNNESYSVTKYGLAINGYSLLNTKRCPKTLATKYFLSIRSNFNISSKVYSFLVGREKLISDPSSSYKFKVICSSRFLVNGI